MICHGACYMTKPTMASIHSGIERGVDLNVDLFLLYETILVIWLHNSYIFSGSNIFGISVFHSLVFHSLAGSLKSL